MQGTGSNSRFYMAKVSKVIDSKSFAIVFNAPGFIEEGIAYPIENQDEPNEGDEIIVFNTDNQLGICFLWFKMRTKEFTSISINNGKSVIEVRADSVQISTKEGNTIKLNSDGMIEIESNADIKFKAKGMIEFESQIGYKMNSSGKGNPVTPGPFCIIDKCRYDGQPHSSNMIFK